MTLLIFAFQREKSHADPVNHMLKNFLAAGEFERVRTFTEMVLYGEVHALMLSALECSNFQLHHGIREIGRNLVLLSSKEPLSRVTEARSWLN